MGSQPVAAFIAQAHAEIAVRAAAPAAEKA
jgi:hypothetical protein